MKIFGLSAILLGALASGQAVAADTPRFKVFGAASYVSPLGEDDVDFGSVRDSVKASDEVGWNVGFEARFNRLCGLEIDYVNATHDIELGGNAVAEVTMQPLSATLNFHVIPTGIVDLYFGPTASYFNYSGEELISGLSFEADDEFAYGASVGLEIGLGDTLALLGGVRWLKVDFPSDVSEEFAVDPLFSRLGLALRF